MEWNFETEEICKQIAIECQILYMCHLDSYNSYRKQSYFFIFPTIVISSIVGGVSMSSIIDNNAIKWSIASLSIFVGILNSLFKILNIQDNENNHYLLSKLYYMLYEKIRFQLMQNPENRETCNIFIENITEAKMKLIEQNLVISNNILSSYKHKYKNANINLPLELKHLSPIISYKDIYKSITPLTPSTPSLNSNVVEFAI
jgi:hypothetical protein